MWTYSPIRRRGSYQNGPTRKAITLTEPGLLSKTFYPAEAGRYNPAEAGLYERETHT